MTTLFAVIALVVIGFGPADDILTIRAEEFEPGVVYRTESECLARIARSDAASVGVLDRVALICRRVNVQ